MTEREKKREVAGAYGRYVARNESIKKYTAEQKAKFKNAKPTAGNVKQYKKLLSEIDRVQRKSNAIYLADTKGVSKKAEYVFIKEAANLRAYGTLARELATGVKNIAKGKAIDAAIHTKMLGTNIKGLAKNLKAGDHLSAGLYGADVAKGLAIPALGAYGVKKILD